MSKAYQPGRVFEHEDGAEDQPVGPEGGRGIDYPRLARWAWPVLAFGISTAASIGANRALTEWRVAAIERQAGGLEARMAYVEQHGQEDQERRISKLENQGADRTAVEVSELTKQIADLAATVRADHDVLVRLVTLYDKNRQ